MSTQRAAPKHSTPREPAASRKRAAPAPALEEEIVEVTPTNSPFAPPISCLKDMSFSDIDSDEKEKMMEERSKKTKEKMKRVYNKKQADNKEKKEKQKEELVNGVDSLLPPKRNTIPNKNVTQYTELSTDPIVRRRQCKVCFNAFQSKDKLKRHMRSHQDVVEARCKQCGALFKYGYNTKAHSQKCFPNSRKEMEEQIVEKYFPEFLRQLDSYSKNPMEQMPALPEGFKMDKNGLVTGYSPILDVNCLSMIPGFDKVNQAEENSDESDE